MADLKYPTKNRLDLASALEPMKLMIDDKPVIGMVVGDQLLTICADRGMSTTRISNAKVTFLGFLTREESFTITGSEDPDWVMPEEAVPVLDGIPLESPARDVPDFTPYLMRCHGRDYEALNVPCDDERRRKDVRIVICWRSGEERPMSQWADLKSDNTKFMGCLDDQSLERWRKHNLVTSYGIRDVSKWPT